MKLKYNAFRGLHKGQPQSEISKLWKAYKEGEYSPETAEPVEAPNELSVEEEIHSQVKIAAMVDEEHPNLLKDKPLVEATEAEHATDSDVEVGKNKMSLCNDFNRAVRRFARFGSSMKESEAKKYEKRLAEIAKKTMPKGYSCSPTDSWKIWFGPTSKCLLINVTNEMAFKIDRDWWQRNYQTTVYVDRSLLKSNDLMDSEALRYAKKGRYLPRYPIVGVECKLPQSYHDIKLR